MDIIETAEKLNAEYLKYDQQVRDREDDLYLAQYQRKRIQKALDDLAPLVRASRTLAQLEERK